MLTFVLIDYLTIFSESEKRGEAIFFGKGNCSECHGGFNFTNFGFENNGLYLEYEDIGRGRISLLTEDKGKFKVPTLRNVEKTAPYMHDGSLPTLEAVVEHYNSGGKGHQNQSLEPFPYSPHRSAARKAQLLTDLMF